MELKELSILAGGVLTLYAGVLHILFDRRFRWKSDLKKLKLVNSQVLYTIHIFLIPHFFFFGIISLLFAPELASGSGIGGAVTIYCALFWLARGVWQHFYFAPRSEPEGGIKYSFHVSIMIVCLVFFICYGYPAVDNILR